MSKNGICGIRSYTQSGVDNLINLTNGLSGLPGAAVRQAEGVEGEGERAGEERRRSQGSMLQNFFCHFGGSLNCGWICGQSYKASAIVNVFKAERQKSHKLQFRIVMFY